MFKELRKRLASGCSTVCTSTLSTRDKTSLRRRVGNFGHTFRWIFDDNAEHGFADWLRHGQEIFWINGLAASGKSSLTDFIYRHLQPRGDGFMSLRRWAELRTVRVLSFFFFKPTGNELLKNFSGFWRSMCYQLLSQDNNLFDIVLADDDGPFCIRSVLINDLARTSLTNRDLKEAFFFLLRHASQSANYLILVDGLDEFIDSQEQLIDIQYWRRSRKLVILSKYSARPDQSRYIKVDSLCIHRCDCRI